MMLETKQLQSSVASRFEKDNDCLVSMSKVRSSGLAGYEDTLFRGYL